MDEYVNIELVRNITYYIQTNYIINTRTCNKSCLKLISSVPQTDVCIQYCLIKTYVVYLVFLFKFWIFYKLLQNIIKDGSWILAIIYVCILFFI